MYRLKLQKVCDYLNDDLTLHSRARWRLDVGKLVTAIEAAGLQVVPTCLGPRDWMGEGWKVFIRCSRVYLWNEAGDCYRTDVDNGRWIDHPDQTKEPWECMTGRLSAEQAENFQCAARDCYCYRGVDRCDFCTGVRTPDGAPSSNGPAFYE